MRILFCTRQFVRPLIGGVDVYADRLGRALQRAGHEISFIALDSAVKTQNGAIKIIKESQEKTQIWRLQFDFAQRPKQAFDQAYDPEMGQAIREILQAYKPDLFIIMNFYMVTLASVEAAKALGIRVIHVATDFLPVCRRATFIRWNGRSCQIGESIKSCAECFVSNCFLGRIAATALRGTTEDTLVDLSGDYQLPHPLWVMKPYWKQVEIMEKRLKTLQPLREQIDLVLAPTQYTRDKFVENGFGRSQVHFIPFAVELDHPLTKVKYEPSTSRRFLFIGRLQPYKGAHLLIEAFNNLKSPCGATLTLYGTADSGYEVYYKSLMEKVNSNENIAFKGKIAPSDLSNAFAQSDYFVLPSTWHENSPLIVLDSLQSNTPVISSNIGGVTDLVQHEVNGLLFPMGDVDALRNVLQRAIDQPDLLGKLKSGNNLPDIDDYAEKMLQLIGEKI